MQQNSLPDYFYSERNMLANVSETKILHSQKQLQRILENPLIFIFYVLERIEYANYEFPILKFSQLVKLLTNEESIISKKEPDLIINCQVIFTFTIFSS